MINLTNKTDKAKYLIWLNKKLRILERVYSAKLRGVLRDQFEDAADYFLHGIGQQSIEDAVNWNKQDLIKVYTEMYENTASQFYNFTIDRLKGTHPKEKKVTQEQLMIIMSTWIRKHTARNVQHVQGSTKRIIRSIVDKAVSEGKTNAEIAKEILKVGSIVEKYRARMIVRTEIHSASIATIDETMQQSEIGYTKEWLSALDERTRADHAFADGQEVEKDEPFIVGDEKLMVPGDPDGSPENIINCRCNILYNTKKV